MVRNVGTFGVDATGEATSGKNHESESTDATPRGGLPRSSEEAEECPWSEGGRSSTSEWVNWRQEEPAGFDGGRQLS